MPNDGKVVSEERQVHSVLLSLHDQVATCVGVFSELRAIAWQD